MAKIIKAKKRKNGGFKAAKKAVTRVVTKTKTLYRKAKGINVTKKDVVISVAAAGAGSVGGAIVLQKITGAADSKWISIAKAAAIAAAGGYITYLGVKKRNMAVAGAGMGMATVGATNIISKFTAKSTVAAPYINPTVAAPIRYRRPVNAPFIRPVAGCRKVADVDYN